MIHRSIVRPHNTKNTDMKIINDITFSDDMRILIKCDSNKNGSVIIPEGVMGIKGKAFFGCSIESITFPATIQRIGNKAFANCKHLKRIELPEGLLYLGKKAFDHCKALSSVIVPSSLEELQNGVFAYCTALKTVTFADPGLLSLGNRCFIYCVSLENIVIPESVTSMGNAFCHCWKLKKVVIKSKKIQGNEKKIFEDCCCMENTTLVDPVHRFFHCDLKIEKAPDFKWSHKNKGVKIKKKMLANIDDGLTMRMLELVVRIDEFAYYKSTGLVEISIPGTVRKISPFAFDGCTSLSILTIKEGVEKIEKFAFHGCTKLTSVVLPSSIKEIGIAAFAGCSSLTNVTLSKDTHVEENAFEGTSQEFHVSFLEDAINVKN